MSKEKFVRNKPHVNIGTLLVVFSMITALSFSMVIYESVILFSDRDGDTVPDNVEARSKHSLFFEVKEDRLSYQTYETVNGSSASHELGHNVDMFHESADDLLEIRSSFYDDVSTGIPNLEFSWKYESLIEFVDSDSNGLFEPATDTVLGQTLLTNMIRVNFGFGIDGQPVYYSQFSTSDGKLIIDFYTAREHVLLGRQVGLVLAPGEIKSFLTFTDFTPITGGTKLALNLSLSSSHNLIFSNSKVEASKGEYKAEYEWADWIIRDGSEGIVNTTIPTSTIPEKNALIYINFGSFTNASYDPHYRWFTPPIKSNTAYLIDFPWPYLAIGSVATVMLVSLIYVVRKRPGRVKYSDITLKKG
ncbi:MAG: hypothetical protein KGD59_08455 [Candidatus Heimdallarchaeota archaeon]|nr:hypothetical protein [Candidatus Heimdallarchaeota archaeon]MBY8994567.1 hypothetical protein [Candidatus Heimdallarchaeota archaeon]